MKEVYDYSDRYAYLDGAPYATKGIRRFLSTPPVQATTLVLIMLAASQEVLNRTPNSPSMFIPNLIQDIGVSLLNIAYGLWLFHNPIGLLPKNAVIDKTGRSAPDLSANMSGKRHYVSLSASSFTVSAVIYATTQTLGFHHITEFVQLTYGLCAFRNLLKLSSGKWSINTSPPRPKPNSAFSLAQTMAKQEIK